MSSPASTGTLGRTGRLRAAQATASASTSRSTRNFTVGVPSGRGDTPRKSWGPGLGGESCHAHGDGGRFGVVCPDPDRDAAPEIGGVVPRSGPGWMFTEDRSVWRYVGVTALVETVENSCSCRSAAEFACTGGVQSAGHE